MVEGISGYDEVLNIHNASFLNDEEDNVGAAEKVGALPCTLSGPVSDPKDPPKWNPDRSSTGQALEKVSEVILHPQAIFRDPLHRGKNILGIFDRYKFGSSQGPKNGYAN
ncbi:hypothetical protein SUGI_0866450 [Cryptomeria japonica]|nr:hypothetical protein SUGI_0866450 [Cryptomeria japonica]